MKFIKKLVITTGVLAGFAYIHLFCGDPVRPNFDKGPVIKNDEILAIGTLEYGKPYTFYVEIIEGSEPLAFQWIKDTSVITAINNDTLHFTKLSLSDSGIYWCIVTNEFGADTSLKRTLQVSVGDSVAPVILNNKSLLTFGTEKVDSLYGMYLQAIGTDTLYYVWYKNGSLLNNENNDTLLFNALAYSDTGYYYCIVTNDFGSAISNKDTLSLAQQQNSPPQWSVDTMHVTVYEASSCTLALSDSCLDPDGDSLTFSMKQGAPLGDSIVKGAYVFTPGYTDSGVYYITLNATDSKLSSSAILKLTVLNANRPPLFLDSLPDYYYYVDEGAKLVLAFKAVDPDGDSVFYKLAKNELPGTTVFNDSQLVWQSDNDDSGYYHVEIKATDGTKDTTTAPKITVAVGNVNQYPHAVNDTATTLEDNNCSVSVLTNDSDPDGDVVNLISVSNGKIGTCAINTNQVIYTPKADSFGVDTVVYTISDSTRATAQGKIFLTVTPVNDAPSFTAGANIIVHQDTGTVSASGWAENISKGPVNESNQTLKFVPSCSAPAGLFSVSPSIDSSNGNLAFTVSSDTFGVANVRVILKDNGGTANNGKDTSDAVNFTITVTEVNHRPVFTTPTQPTTTITMNEAVSQAIAFVVSDPDNTTPVVQVVSQPSWASLISTGVNEYRLTLNPGYTLATNAQPQYTTALTVRATDQKNNTLYSDHTVNLTINNVNRVPIISDPKPADTTIQVGRYYEIGLTAQDADNDPLTYTFIQTPSGMFYDTVSKKIKWNIDRLQFVSSDGPYTVQFYVSDGSTLTAGHSWVVTLQPHQWEYMGQIGVVDGVLGQEVFTALDSMIVFRTKINGMPQQNITKLSQDGGKTWSSEYTQQIQSAGFSCALDNKLYLLEKPVTGGCNLGGEIVEIYQNQMTFINKFNVKTPGGCYDFWFHQYAINMLGNIFMTAKSRNSSEQYNVFVYDTDDPDSLVDLGIDTFSTIYFIKAARKLKIAFLFSDSAIYRKDPISGSWSKAGQGRMQFYDRSITDADVCSDFGDTIYVVDQYSGFFRCTNAKAPSIEFSVFTLPINNVEKIKMINSRAGWVINTDGQVFYTKNGLSALSREYLVDSTGAETVIKGIYMASDAKSYFAIGGGKLFRY